MGYRYKNYRRRSTSYTGRPFRSAAYRADGGANDEGFHWRWCSICVARTEHELDACIKCDCTPRRG